jgi:hypothetical protein
MAADRSTGLLHAMPFGGSPMFLPFNSLIAVRSVARGVRHLGTIMRFRSSIAAIILLCLIQMASVCQGQRANLKVKVLLPGGLTTSGIYVMLCNTLNDNYDGKFTNDEGVCVFKKLNPEMTYFITTAGCPYRPFKSAPLTPGSSHLKPEVILLEPVENTKCGCFAKPDVKTMLTGILTDEDCEPIQGAEIVLSREDNLVAKALTDTNGCFCFSDLPPYAHYALRTEPVDHFKAILRNVSIEPTKSTIVRMCARIGFVDPEIAPRSWWQKVLNIKRK